MSPIGEYDLVESTDGDMGMADEGVWVDWNEGGGDGFTGFEIKEVASEVSVDVWFGVNVYVVEVCLGGNFYSEVFLVGGMDGVSGFRVFAFFGVYAVVLFPFLQVGVVGIEGLCAVVQGFPVAVVVD